MFQKTKKFLLPRLAINAGHIETPFTVMRREEKQAWVRSLKFSLFYSLKPLASIKTLSKFDRERDQNARGKDNSEEFHGHGGVLAGHETWQALRQRFHLRSHSQVPPSLSFPSLMLIHFGFTFRGFVAICFFTYNVMWLLQT